MQKNAVRVSFCARRIRGVARFLVAAAFAVLMARPEPAAAAAKIACAEPVYDFGVVTGQKDIEHSFTIENAGDADLRLSGVRTTCGCTTTDFKEKTLAPGEKMSIGVKLSLHGRTGKQEKSVFVLSDDPVTPQFKVDLSGNVVPDIAVEPSSLSFGSLRPGAEATRVVEIRAREGIRFKVTNLETNQAGFCAFSLETVQEGVSYRLTARVLPAALARGGAMVSRVLLHTDYPDYSRVEVPVNLFVEHEIMAIPTQLVLTPSGSAGANELLARYILVRCAGDRPIELVDVVLPAEGMTQRVEKLSPGQLRVRVADIRRAKDLDGKEIKIRIRKQDGEVVGLNVPIRIIE